MQLFRPALLCVVFSAVSPWGGAAEPMDATSQAKEVVWLRHELLAKDAEIARLEAALNVQILRDTAVVALSDQPSVKRSTRELTPSSSIPRDKAEQIARLFGIFKPGSSFCTVLPTGSMKPFFDEKAILLMEAAPFEDLKVGDIVTYRHPRLGLPVVHRLVLKDGDKFWAKGDANDRMDSEYVTRENYLRRVFGLIYSKE
jgi:signal peptidase